jgi:hypothetical protein
MYGQTEATARITIQLKGYDKIGSMKFQSWWRTQNNE